MLRVVLAFFLHFAPLVFAQIPGQGFGDQHDLQLGDCIDFTNPVDFITLQYPPNVNIEGTVNPTGSCLTTIVSIFLIVKVINWS